MRNSCPLYPQKRTLIDNFEMSAKTQKQTSHLLDHLNGEREKLLWNLEAKRFRSLEVNDQFELGRLHDRHVAGLLALKNAADVDTDLAHRVWTARVIGHQPAGVGINAAPVHRRHLMMRRQCRDVFMPAVVGWLLCDQERAYPLLRPARQMRSADTWQNKEPPRY
jgi:hypothetical protein